MAIIVTMSAVSKEDFKKISLQEARNMHQMYDLFGCRGSFKQFVKDGLQFFPKEVECELCGAPFVLNEQCLSFDDMEQPLGGHVTIQLPLRPWNRLLA